MNTLPCKTCKGEMVIRHDGFTALDGTVYPPKTYGCSSCHGSGTFTEPDQDQILSRIKAKQGKNKGKLRASMTSNFKDGNEARAYYVWRIARFHGGADVTLPMMADLGVRGDPYKDQLDILATEVAKDSFGTDLAGALRWKRALYG
jgi:hypothetical protein